MGAATARSAPQEGAHPGLTGGDPRFQLPCRCLCLGFGQMIITRPFLLITLHFSHILFTEGLTFMARPPFQRCR